MRKRSVATILVAAAMAAAALPTKEAMAIKGQCDPGAGNLNSETTSVGDPSTGQVRIITRYGWDGISVFPACVGAIQDVRITSNAPVNWYVTLPSNRRGGLSLRVPPGTDVTYTGAQLSQVGLQTNEDLAGCVWTNILPATRVFDLP